MATSVIYPCCFCPVVVTICCCVQPVRRCQGQLVPGTYCVNYLRLYTLTPRCFMPVIETMDVCVCVCVSECVCVCVCVHLISPVLVIL